MAGEKDKLASGVFQFDKLPVQKSEGAAFRHILEGQTATGDYLEIHETVLEPGGAPHPPHHHDGERNVFGDPRDFANHYRGKNFSNGTRLDGFRRVKRKNTAYTTPVILKPNISSSPSAQKHHKPRNRLCAAAAATNFSRKICREFFVAVCAEANAAMNISTVRASKR